MFQNKLMQWKRETSGALVLWVQEGKTWVRYNKHHLAVPDHDVPNGSLGYATMQKLLKLDYKLIPTPQED